MKILDRYILKRFLFIYAGNLVSFTLLFIVIDAVNNLDGFVSRTDGFWDLLTELAECYAALTPVVFCQVLGPVVAVSAALFSVTTLQRANEFTPVLASGRSYQRAFIPILGASLAVCLAVFLLQELWIPRTLAEVRRAAVSRRGRESFRNFRHVDLDRGNLLSLQRYNRKDQSAEGILVFPLFPRPGHRHYLSARSAQWTETGGDAGYWTLRQGIVQEYDEQGDLVTQAGAGAPSLYRPFEEYRLETSLTPEDIELSREQTVYTPLGALRRKAESSLDQSNWTIKYLGRFVSPLNNFILVLLGLPIMIYFGSRNVFVGALVTVGICAAYFGVHSACQEVGVRGLLPARVGAVLAPIFFASLGATFYRGMRS
jgi:lipopolysaccharide export system permease protein